MKRRYLILGLALAMVAACKHAVSVPRETIGLVHGIVDDTLGLRSVAARAGWSGADGVIALLGEPQDVVSLGRQFCATDRVDNVDGSENCDSLPDFAGEIFHIYLDAFHAPYSRFAGSPEGLEDLREIAVKGALHAWDTVCFRTPADHKALQKKGSAKILIYTSSLQAEYGLFDVDTLQQLTGGKSHVLSPVDILLDQALADEARNIVVWASDAVKEAKVWENALQARHPEDVNLTVLTPAPAEDVRTQFRDILRQCLVPGLPQDALILDVYGIDLDQLQAELVSIRLSNTEEDLAFGKILPTLFRIYDPAQAVIRSTYDLLRKEDLFAHRIDRPVLKYYESVQSNAGQVVLVETTPSNVDSAYVPSLH